MDSLSAHGLRGSYDPSRRGFLITMLGAGVMLGYARCGLAAVEGIVSERNERAAPASCSNRRSGMASIPEGK